RGRERGFRGEELRDVAPPLLGERDQLLLVVPVRRGLRDLALVVFTEALDEALRIVGRVAERDQELRRRFERRGEDLAHERPAVSICCGSWSMTVARMPRPRSTRSTTCPKRPKPAMITGFASAMRSAARSTWRSARAR